MEKQNLKGMSLSELEAFAQSLGEKRYRGAQIYSWLYAKGVQSFEEMTDVSKDFRTTLSNTAIVDGLEIVSKQESTDGTTKYLFRLNDGLAIESVLIPPERKSPDADSRLTICISTQVGCPLDCKFCATGTMGFTRNLTAGEILDQVLQVQRLADRRITNVVYMGMGEPMLNYDNVMKSVGILNDDRGLNIGVRHITISTAGYADKIRQMADEHRKTKLALSLHSLDEQKRTLLMPITRKFGVNDLIAALEHYYRKTRQRPTFEYILFDGFNDTEADMRRFVAVSKRIPCKVNIIPFHSIDFTHPTGFAASLKPTPPARVEEFADRLRKADITVMVRGSSGVDIKAACGQLAVEGKNPPVHSGRQSSDATKTRSTAQPV